MSQQHWRPDGSLQGRTAIVTGCASVVVVDVGTAYSGYGASEGPATESASEICALGYKAVPDTHSVVDAQKIVDIALSSLGRVDILINGAGINRYGKLENYSTADLKEILETNTLGSLPVVNIASSSVLGTVDYTPYITSKAGLVGLTKALAAEFDYSMNIKINAVAPISASRMTAPALTDERTIKNFELARPPARNAAIILALAIDASTFNGEFFSTGGYKVHRIVFGMLPGYKG
ncbi:uncharacterized protein Z519_08600 [Cladophialophora bantiana CBS 173.52]|uniref:Uncharacterized protein n=1 Tax=Cladophialophora bantiana (strain ATCC 10958 / CBS 173.52 / CDC B-1940 / NIH 8579) TaxID=1442370 RepID=A0A0D2FWA9_CLAB1|nr:uncharacterized protein Z519_08600 [Cladophialophora bantiana CBS 173.52]KIW90817.1 hypothetical protein Z519_08600 [Cladophialophora bantiana CBS 173.52]